MFCCFGTKTYSISIQNFLKEPGNNFFMDAQFQEGLMNTNWVGEQNNNLSPFNKVKVNIQLPFLPFHTHSMLTHHNKRFYLKLRKSQNFHINYFTSGLKYQTKLLKLILFPLRC